MKHSISIALAILFFSFVTSCKDSTEKKNISKIDENISQGLVFAQTKDIDQSVEKLKSFIKNDESLTISTEFNHSKNAENAGLELTQNEVYFIDNPRYSIPLIEENSLTALEFPMRIGFYEINDEKFSVARSQDYFIQRYNLTNSAALRSIETISETFIKQSTGADFTQTSPIDSLDTNGIKSLVSTKKYEETLESILSGLENNEDITLIESKNFTEEATEIGFNIKPLHLFVFGNPKVGTELMKQNPNFSIDLPLKVLVEENEDNEVLVHFQDLSFTAKLHGEEYENDLPKRITNNLNEMLTKAISEEE